jgi:hypothetical protein
VDVTGQSRGGAALKVINITWQAQLALPQVVSLLNSQFTQFVSSIMVLSTESPLCLWYGARSQLLGAHDIAINHSAFLQQLHCRGLYRWLFLNINPGLRSARSSIISAK